MADRKRPKLSLKRKTSSSLSFLSKVDKREGKKAALPNIKSIRNTNDDVLERDRTVTVEEVEDVILIEPDEVSQNCQSGSKRLKSSTSEVALNVTINNTDRPQPDKTPRHTKKSVSFFDVDEDLLKLRLMFVRLKRPLQDVKSLTDLPAFHSDQKSETSTVEDRKDINENLNSELSPLPPLCSWCRKRKPTDYSEIYSKIIENIMEPKQSVLLFASQGRANRNQYI